MDAESGAGLMSEDPFHQCVTVSVPQPVPLHCITMEVGFIGGIVSSSILIIMLDRSLRVRTFSIAEFIYS